VSDDVPPSRQPTEEELRAAYEAELKKVRVEDVIVQTAVSLINLGARKAGLAPGSEDERDPDQVHQAIEAVRALWPQVESALGPDAAKLREPLSQLQMAYAQMPREPAGEKGGQEPPQQQPQQPEQGEGPGPAQSSGRLWVPGQ
jgi:hypothetical protein